MHHRLAPKRHRFNYNVFMFYLDLDELDLLKRNYLFLSHNKFNFFSFRDSEHLQLPLEKPDLTKNTKQHVIEYLKTKNVDASSSKIMILTNLNILGYNFNPVSFYFVFNPNNKPLCCIAEVGNTFGEMKPYFLGEEHLIGNRFDLNTIKHFYVSPFLNHDANFDFSLQIPDEKLNLKIDTCEKEKKVFISTLIGNKKPISNLTLLFYSLRFPFLTVRIIFLIHFNALLLVLKKLKYHKKDEDQHLQKDVYRKYK